MTQWSPGFRTLACAFVLALIPPLLGISDFYIHLLVLMVIYAIFAMSLDLMMGYGGLPSLGHAAFFGLGAYGVGIAMVKFGLNWWEASLTGLAVCMAIGALFGLIALRTRGLYFLLITLALGQLLWGAVNRWGSFTGGFNGLPGIPRPAHWLMSTSAFYYLSLGMLLVLGLLMQRLVTSPFGLALRAISDSETRASAIGFNAWLHRYAAFLIGSMIAGLAGILNVFYNGFVSPRDLSISMSAEAILMVILGGTRTLWGPVVGAVVIVTLRNWLIILGGIFILVVLLAPNGIAGLFASSQPHTPDAEPPLAPLPHLVEPSAPNTQSESSGYTTALAIESLSKSFGGVRAVNNVTFGAASGKKLALLGPNGAGKTTLFHMISGALPPDQGSIRLFGTNLAGVWASAERFRSPTYFPV
jgi:branched-chain amino acid transport system permease protein